jgi:leader peptidase (prepilin peptidase)/N-methyltransferase
MNDQVSYALVGLLLGVVIAYPSLLLTRYLHHRLAPTTAWAYWQGALLIFLVVSLAGLFGYRLGLLISVSVWGLLLVITLLLVGIVSFVLDARLRYLPDTLLYLGAIMALVLRCIIDGTILPALEGLFLSLLFWGAIYFAASWLYKSKEAFGLGDVLLGSFVGVGLGPMFAFVSFAVGILLGGVFSLGYLLIRRGTSRREAIPYGPFLIIGMFLVVLIFSKGILVV